MIELLMKQWAICIIGLFLSLNIEAQEIKLMSFKLKICIHIQIIRRERIFCIFTFGFKRVEILSGFVNGLSLVFISGYILKEAILRIFNSDEAKVKGSLVLIVGFLGLLVNFIGLKLLETEKDHSINVDGAYQHIIADLLGSIGALIAGIGIILFRAYWLDTFTSIIVSLLILKP